MGGTHTHMKSEENLSEFCSLLHHVNPREGTQACRPSAGIYSLWDISLVGHIIHGLEWAILVFWIHMSFIHIEWIHSLWFDSTSCGPTRLLPPHINCDSLSVSDVRPVSGELHKNKGVIWKKPFLSIQWDLLWLKSSVMHPSPFLALHSCALQQRQVALAAGSIHSG